MLSILKKIVKWITRPKITIFLNGGCFVTCRKFPYYDEFFPTIIEKSDRNKKADYIYSENVIAVSVRKWWQKWA
jgi:hypothetical protein